WNLRSSRSYRRLRAAFVAARSRLGTRITHFSVQGNHIHLIVEPESREALARAIKGVCVRMARSLNRMMDRSGSVVAERCHAHVPRNPAEVRHALDYVLHNYRRHAEARGEHFPPGWVDPFCSAAPATALPWSVPPDPPPIVEPRTWLLREGWRR